MSSDPRPGTLVLLHRRRRTLSQSAFAGDWGTLRARRMKTHLEALGRPAYRQVQPVPRWNPADLAIRLSRSWPLVALLSLSRGLAPPRPRWPRERWDLVELLTWPDRHVMIEQLESEAGQSTLDALAEDARPKTATTVTMACETSLAHDGPLADGATTLYALRWRAGGGADYWLSDHAPRVLAMREDLGFVAYAQHVTVHAGPVRDAPEPLGGLADLVYAQRSDIEAGLFSIRALRANMRLVRDEAGFIDAGRSVLVMGEIRHARPAGD